jgi:O-antigen ligase
MAATTILGMASPRRKHFPRLTVVGLIWLVFVNSLTRFQVGPISVSGFLTLITAVLCLRYLPTRFLAERELNPGKGTLQRPGTAVPWPLIAFMVVAWVRLAFSPSVDGLQNVAVYTAFICAVAAGTMWAPPWQVVSLLRALRVVAISVPAIFLASRAAGIEVYGGRSFALTCLIFVAVLIPYRGERLVYKLGPILVVTASFLSLSRTAAVIGASLLIFLAVRSRQKYRALGAGLFAAAVGGGLYWAITSYTPFRDRFIGGDQAVTIGGFKLNTSGRSTLWEVVTESAALAPWFGHGPGSAGAFTQRLLGIEHPHNEYLRLWHDLGAVGLVLLLLGLVLLIYRVWQRARRTDDQIHWVALIALLGVSAAAFTDNVIVYPFVMVPLGVIVGCSLAQTLPSQTLERPRRRLIGTGPAPVADQRGVPNGYQLKRPTTIAR